MQIFKLEVSSCHSSVHLLERDLYCHAGHYNVHIFNALISKGRFEWILREISFRFMDHCKQLRILKEENKWTCPICEIPVNNVDNLYIDSFILNVLSQTTEVNSQMNRMSTKCPHRNKKRLKSIKTGLGKFYRQQF